MDALMIIIAFSVVIWYLVDRAKDSIWNNFKWSKWCTIIFSAALSAACTLCFGLDIIFALNIAEAPSIMGQILTILILMSGSSGVSEIIQRIRGEKKAE